MARRIFVSKDYKQPFEAVYRLIQAGALPKSPYRALENNVIFDGTYEYELSSLKSGASEHVTHFFAEDGATWFRCLRGEAEQNDDDIWCNFMITVRDEYHRLNSVLEYEQEISQSDAEAKKAQKQAAKLLVKFVDVFFPFLKPSESDVHTVHEEKVYEHIFGVSMRVELSAEATSGASLPLLCKLYFVKNGSTIKPITWQVAKQYDRDILQIVPDDVDVDCVPDETIIDHTLVAVENLIKDSTLNFANYTWFSEIEMPTTDEEEQAANLRDAANKSLSPNEIKQRRALRKLYVQMAHENFALQCQRVDVLYISHIKAQSYVCEFCHDGVPLLRAQMGINNALTLRCMACDERTILMDRDEIVYRVDDEERSVVLDRDAVRFGLTDEQIEEIRTYGEFSKHLKQIFCSKSCARVRCDTQLFEAEGKKYCKDCRYPDVVYIDYDGNRYHTPSLVVAIDQLKVYPGVYVQTGQLVKCALCGRVVTAGELAKERWCKNLCAPAMEKKDKDKAKALYKRYRNMLTFAARFFGGKGDRLCYEDDEAILFTVGRKRYIYSKLATREHGYLSRPVRLK